MSVLNLLKKTLPAEHPLVRKRRLVCLSCPKRTDGRVLGLAFGQKGAFCTMCWCLIVLKTKCPDEPCELGKWKR